MSKEKLVRPSESLEQEHFLKSNSGSLETKLKQLRSGSRLLHSTLQLLIFFVLPTYILFMFYSHKCINESLSVSRIVSLRWWLTGSKKSNLRTAHFLEEGMPNFRRITEFVLPTDELPPSARKGNSPIYSNTDTCRIKYAVSWRYRACLWWKLRPTCKFANQQLRPLQAN